MIQVGEVFVPATGPLVRLQVVQSDDANRDAVECHAHTAGNSVFEAHPVDPGLNLDPVRW